MTEKCRIHIFANDPILPSILEIVTLAYQHYDPANIPGDIDQWPWYDSIFLFYRIPKWDPLSPVTATLCINEDGIRRFEIDLVFPCICDRLTLKQHRTPPDMLDLLKEVRSHVRNTSVRRRLIREMIYYRQLVVSGFLSRQEFNNYREGTPNSGWKGTCPACFDSKIGKGSKLIACVACEELGCANRECHGYDTHGILQSVLNVGEAYCMSCNGEGENVRLVCCPECRSKWFNPRRHPRCVGRPEPFGDTCIPGGSKNSRQKELFRRPEPKHPPIIAPCDECRKEDTEGWLHCSSLLCWSQNGVVCKACSPNGGKKYFKGQTWVCDVCACHRETSECCSTHETESENQGWLDVENSWPWGN